MQLRELYPLKLLMLMQPVVSSLIKIGEINFAFLSRQSDPI